MLVWPRQHYGPPKATPLYAGHLGAVEHQDLKPLNAEVLRRREELAAGENSGGDQFDTCA
jgi:hypothetical protein